MTSNKHKFRFKNVLDTPYCMELLEWRNQKFIRENMVDKSIIDSENHLKYIERLRASSTQKVFIAFYDDNPVAVMTFKFMDNIIESGSYVIHEEDMGSGFGVVTGYARFEYIFDRMPEGKMQTIILAHNQKNISLQKNFGCMFEGTTRLKKSDGIEEDAYIYTMTRDKWEINRPRIQRVVSRLIPIENIGRILDV